MLLIGILFKGFAGKLSFGVHKRQKSNLIVNFLKKPWHLLPHKVENQKSDPIGQFRIPGRTGASGVKPTKVRLMRGRNESTRAAAMANHYCFAFNCTNKKQKNI